LNRVPNGFRPFFIHGDLERLRKQLQSFAPPIRAREKRCKIQKPAEIVRPLIDRGSIGGFGPREISE